MQNILLLSSDRYKQLESFEWCVSILNDFFAKTKQIALVPYAQVGDDFNEYEKLLKNKINSKIVSIHSDPINILKESDGVLVSGGNLFVLLYRLQQLNLLDTIKDKINNSALYAGWGAGASLLSEDIKTCNDLPILYPNNLKALGILKYQIITEYIPQDKEFALKLFEYFKLHQNSSVFALPYGSALKIHNDNALVMGNEGVLKLSEYYEQYFKIGDFIKL